LPSVIDEPQEISGGGSRIYRKRYWVTGDSQDLTQPTTNRDRYTYWSIGGNSIANQAPGYASMLHSVECPHAVGYCTWYGGKINSVNGVLGIGREAPLVPHQGMLFMIKDNAILAFSHGGGSNPLPLLEIQPAQDHISTLDDAELTNRLEGEIEKILDVYIPQDPNRFLKPGYYNDGENLLRHHDDYFRNPGETLYTLSLAHPYLSSTLKGQLNAYLEDYYQTYFGSTLYARTGWSAGTSRNAMIFPPQVEAEFADYPKSKNPGNGWSWNYPQNNIYSLWKYAQINPAISLDAYNKAKSVIEFHSLDDIYKVNSDGTIVKYADRFLEYPFEAQGYIAGYIGFVGLYNLVGQPPADIGLKTQVEQYLDDYLSYRYSTFSKDSYWYTGGNHHNRKFNIARNFMWLVPEVGAYFNQNIQQKVRDAVQEYSYVHPYWFISGYQGSYTETAAQPLFDAPSIYQAKAWILNEPRSELSKYLDAPFFERGDLFYIQNLIATIEAE